MTANDRGLAPPEFADVVKDHNFRVVHSEKGAYFDQALVVLASDTLQLRFAKDRGFIFVDIADVGGRFTWRPLFQLRYLLLGCDPGETPAKAEEADFLRNNYPAIEHLFATEDEASLTRRLDPLNRERTKKLMALPNKFKR